MIKECRELLLEVKDLSVGYDGRPILSNVNMKIYKDDLIGVIGPNGGGKSTFIRALLKELTPVSGEIIYHDIKNNIGYLAQNSNIDRQFPITVVEVVLSGLQSKRGLFGGYKSGDHELAMDLLRRCSIERLYKKPIGSLSGGEMQRVLLCRAIISSPELLILDEPNTYVDSKFEKELYELLKELNNDMAIVMVSHDVGTITPYVKSIACVNRSLHYHESNLITQEQLLSYDCPILLVTHGEVPHTVLKNH